MTDQPNDRVERRVQELLQKLSTLPRNERPAFLKEWCDRDAVLSEFVRSLVAAAMGSPTVGAGQAAMTIDSTPDHVPDSTFSFKRSSTSMQTPTLDPATEGAESLDAGSVIVPPPKIFKDPERIGPYRMLEVVGEGGFGTVWVAEQQSPVRRRVALKIIRPGMDSRAVVARFEQERQALAMMDHPNIAKVFDAGTAPDGRPFFVMEFVAGEPITDYCDRNRQSIRQRLELFITVCEAVQHAHHKGIIHRDIKPSNVLVSSSSESAATVKVIDFGVAKAMSQVLTDKTLFTEQGQILGTPEYMSPEQAEMGALDIDTRTDVYALGVMLYELLTGALPFEPRDLRSQGYNEIQRIIREVDPPKPSVRLKTMAAALSQEVAQHRQAKFQELESQLRRELEWIPLKAMRKERDQRYDSPLAMAEDIKNHLAGRPLVAGPESYKYRARKFVIRNRWAVMASSMVTAAVIVGAIVSTVGFVRAARNAKIAAAQADRAKTEAERLRVVNIYNTSLLSNANAVKGERKDVTVRELLDQAVRDLDNGAQAGQPRIEAALRSTLAQTYRSLSQWTASEKQWRKALELESGAAGDDTPEAALAMAGLAQVLMDTNQYDEAGKLLDRVLAIQREQFQPDDPRLAATINHIGLLRQYRGDMKGAEARYREALAVYRHTPLAIAGTADAMTNLAQVIYRTNPREAIDLATEALAMRRKYFGEQHVEVWNSLINLAGILEFSNDLAGAEQMRRESLTLAQKLFDEKNRKIVQSMNALARTLWLRGGSSLAEAETIQSRAVELARQIDGKQSLEMAQAIDLLACIARDRGQFPRAIELFREALAMRSALQSPEHPDTAGEMSQLADTLARADQPREAIELAARALQIRKSKLPAGDWRIASTTSVLGGAYTAAGEFDKAEPLLLESRAALDTTTALAGRPKREATERLIKLYERSGKLEQAARWRAELSRITTSSPVPATR